MQIISGLLFEGLSTMEQDYLDELLLVLQTKREIQTILVNDDAHDVLNFIAHSFSHFSFVYLDSQFSIYSNASSPSLNQDPRGESPTQDSSQNSENFSKLIPGMV